MNDPEPIWSLHAVHACPFAGNDASFYHRDTLSVTSNHQFVTTALHTVLVYSLAVSSTLRVGV